MLRLSLTIEAVGTAVSLPSDSVLPTGIIRRRRRLVQRAPSIFFFLIRFARS